MGVYIYSPSPLLIFVLALSLSLSLSCEEVDTLYFVTGWASASKHTILLEIGTASSIWCQSKYYSLFTDILNNGYYAVHNEICLYVCLVEYELEQCHVD